MSLYQDDINWIDGKGTLNDIKKFFEKHLDEHHNLKEMVENHASESVLNEFGIENVGNRVHNLLRTIVHS